MNPQSCNRSIGLLLAIVASLTTGACSKPEPSSPATVIAVPSPIPKPIPVAESAAEAIAIPDTADAIWQAINTHSAELKATIASGALGEVHHHAFAIRDLVAALPDHSPNLPAEDRTKLESEVKFVSTLAERLDASGDSGDQAGSQANYDQLLTVLDGITRNK